MGRPTMPCLVAVLLLAGCSTWAVSNDSVPTALADHQGDHLRVKVAGRTAFDLHDVETVGDSLVGISGAGARHAVALDDIEYVQVQKTDTVKTGLLMAGVLVVALAVVAATASAAATASLADLPY